MARLLLLVYTDHAVMADLSTTGLYVAFRDLGTCIGLSEVTVFYPVCDVVLLDVGANVSELGFPGDTSSGVCFTNMAIGIAKSTCKQFYCYMYTDINVNVIRTN